MLIASGVLAVLVGGVFVALLLAISTLREATEREARAKDVVAAAVTAEKLVLDLETGLRGLVPRGRPLPRVRRTGADRAARPSREFRAAGASDPAQCSGGGSRSINEYIDDYLPADRRHRPRQPGRGGSSVADERGQAPRRRDPRAVHAFIAAEDAEARGARRRPPTGPTGDRARRARGSCLGGADPRLRRLPRAVDRRAGARRRAGREPARRPASCRCGSARAAPVRWAS